MMLYLFLAHISHQIIPYLYITGFWKLAATMARYSDQAAGVETGIDRGNLHTNLIVLSYCLKSV
ncbi:hypothetical protein Hanom_Chr13g01223341 [Helianthus anomalus]